MLLTIAPEPRGFGTLFASTGFFGPLMLLLGAAALALAVRRWLELRPGRLAPESLQKGLERALRDGEPGASLAQATASRTWLGAVVAAGLHLRAAGLDEVLANVERAAIKESLRLSNRIANLGRLGVVVLLLGLLGTMISLMNAMLVLEQLASPKLGDFVAGIGGALTSTALGLAIALPCFVALFVLENLLARRTYAARGIAEELLREAFPGT
jgi:biopolymer transport protein ExbB